MYQRKTADEYEILGNYGYGDGWEVVCSETTFVEARARLKEYNENEPQYPHKLKVSRYRKLDIVVSPEDREANDRAFKELAVVGSELLINRSIARELGLLPK